MKIAIITGASSGMGREFVKQVSLQKCVEQIWVIARRKERLEALQNEVNTPLRIFAYDLTDAAYIELLKQLILEEKPDIQLLINCSGFAKFGDFEEISEQDSLSMIDLNIRALVNLTMVCIPHMLSGGHILEIASTAAFQPLPYMNVYAASKAFVLSYSRALNRELGKNGISVTAVCPGWTKTEFFDVAKRNASKGAVKNFLFLSKPENVVSRALRDAERGKDLSVYGFFNKLHLFFSKILPISSVMTFWDAMK